MRKKTIIALAVLAVLILAAIVILLVTNQAGQKNDATPPANPTALQTQTAALQNATPEETVRSYLDAWNRKDIHTMDMLNLPANRGQLHTDDLSLEASVDIKAVTAASAEETESRFAATSIRTDGEKALLFADFTVRYTEEGKAEFLQDQIDHTGYGFWLVRDNAETGWLIALQGY